MTVEFTVEELQNLAKLLDMAVRAGGLETASHALPLFVKLQAAAQTQKPEA